ncbi:hypothetical protein DYB32_001724 [Aphanomyces invadans]|uniref:XPG N-terminal domain-containing protein n=1 Tax=Aphanomyces invadans TaxID=157072 RepID=A0A418B5S6_9STRA|nr:hypothetical protein DYB32_001724 [Aphanomyces invadans]
MRDPEDGTMLRNAHLLGTFHRISKLLTHGIRPVFVFDGDTPAIKLKTLQQRRSRREKSQDTLAQAAKKLLIKQQRERTSKITIASVSEEPRPHADEAIEDALYNTILYDEKDDESQSDDDSTGLPGIESFEAHQRDMRQDAREKFLTLAGKPEEYSMAQISTFLKASKLKRELSARQSANDSPESGRRIASESSRRYVYSKASTAPSAMSKTPNHLLDASDTTVGFSSDYVRVQSEIRSVKSLDDDSTTAKKGDSITYGSPIKLDTKHPSWFSGGEVPTSTRSIDLTSLNGSASPEKVEVLCAGDPEGALEFQAPSADTPTATPRIPIPTAVTTRTAPTPTSDTVEETEVEDKELIKVSTSDEDSDIGTCVYKSLASYRAILEWEDVETSENVELLGRQHPVQAHQ